MNFSLLHREINYNNSKNTDKPKDRIQPNNLNKSSNLVRNALRTLINKTVTIVSQPKKAQFLKIKIDPFIIKHKLISVHIN